MTRRRTAIVAILLLLFVVGSQLLRQQRASEAGLEADSPLARESDYYLSGMLLNRFGPDGTLLYHLTSMRVTHYPNPEHSELDTPSLQWMDAGKPDWFLTARSGDLRPDPDNGTTRLLLQHDVLASRTPDDGATLRIRSESLLVLPDAGEASTETAVSLESAGTRLQAASMQAWLRENRVLLSAGSGQHE